MKPEIYVEGDGHSKRKEPYRSARIRYFNETYTDPANTILISTGDFFDSSSVHNEDVLDVFTGILLRFKEVHIVTGNHDLSKKSGNILKPLNNFNSIHVYDRPTEIVIEGIKFLMLPYLPSVYEMAETYPLIQSDADYIVTHFSPPGKNFGAIDEINISHLSGVKLYGHIHEPCDLTDGHIIGVPQMTRLGESWKRRICKINGPDKYEFIDIPDYIRVKEVEFGTLDGLDKNDIVIVKNAPSMSEIRKTYRDFYVSEDHCSFYRSEEEIDFDEQTEALNTDLDKNFPVFAKASGMDKDVFDKTMMYLSTNKKEGE